MSLSSISIQRPVFAWILMFALIFFGYLSFRKMGINDNPDVDFPKIQVSYSYEGATPEVIEKDIIETVENVLVSIEGIRNIDSTADRGSASIQLEFEIDRNIDFALQEVQTLLGRAQRSLPGSIDPPVVTKSNAADEPLMYLNLRSEKLTDRELMILYRDIVRDRLSTIEGVAETRAFGFHEPLLRVDLDANKLNKYQLSANDVVTSIEREHKELPAGRLEFEDSEQTLRIMGEAHEVEEFANMVISRRGGSPNFVDIRLKDVANIYEGLENIRRTSYFNGQRALGIAVQKQSGVNAVATADRVKERLSEIAKDLPEGSLLGVNFDRTVFIRESVNELIFTLLLSALLTSLICWLFLGSWSATFNILLAIPTAIIGTFIFIDMLGFTLNTFSLLGLALAIGVVVDDAIIMLENIVRYMQMGWDRVNASFKGAREITFAVIATTAALISIFIPIAFMNSIEGKFFMEFAATLSIAVALSSLEALTLAPMRCAQFLKTEVRDSKFGRAFDSGMNGLRDFYKRTLIWSLAHRWVPLVISIIFFVISMLAVFKLPTEFAPSEDRGVIRAQFIAPDGKSLEYTTRKLLEFEKLVSANPAVDRTFFAAGGFGQGGQSNRGTGIIVLKERDQRTQSQTQAADALREEAKKVEGIKVFLTDRFGGPFGGRRGSPLEFTLNGPDPVKQKEYFKAMQEKMLASQMMVGTRSDDMLTLPEVHIKPNREKAIHRGTEVSEIASVINATFGGVVAGQYTDRSRRFDIWVQLKKEDREKLKDINKLFVRNNRGELLPLIEVVDIEETSGPQQIYREDRIRGLRVDSELATGVTLGQAIIEVRKIAAEILPADYFIRFNETPDSKLYDTLLIMLMGLIIAYMILAIQFNSFIDPFIVYLAIPFGITGSFIGLLLGGQSLNVYSAIGILLTMGIVKKNSILLVEFTNHLRDQGLELKEALAEACPTRLRPILMTTAATLAAAIPPALALGPGNETRIPMALTVLGGVTLSTFFTLYLVPCVYIFINPIRRKMPTEDTRKNP
jgi:multidrug efflux pump